MADDVQRVPAPPNPATAVKAGIAISPFSYRSLDEDLPHVPLDETRQHLAQRIGGEYVLTESGRHSLHLILSDLKLAREDVITIVTTSGSNYVSSCVTGAVERHCRWSMAVEGRTRAVITIHEFGRACERIADYLGRFPVIEDCAYAYGSRYADGELVGGRGDYALFSLTKMFTVQFGGLVRFPPRRTATYEMPSELRDYLLHRLGPELSSLGELIERRTMVWNDLRERFGQLGARPYSELVEGEVPSVFMFAHDPARVPLQDLREGYEAHGVEASAFWGADAFYVPAHHNLGSGSRQLLADIYHRLVEEHGR